MSWSIENEVYPENISKEARKAIQAKWDRIAAVEGRREGASGLGMDIKWLEGVPLFEGEEAAEEYMLRLHDKQCVAVRFRKDAPMSKEMREAIQARNDARMKYGQLNGAIHYANVKAQFVSCKKCGSRLAREYLHSNFCPMCRADMRPESVQAAIKRADAAVKKAEKRVTEAQKKANRKSGEVMWCLQIFYHT